MRERIRTFLSDERRQFRSWIEKHFPALAREIEQAEGSLHELRQLVFEVESMSWLKGQGLALSYRKVSAKRSSRPAAEKPDRKRGPGEEPLDSGLRESVEIGETRRRLKKAYRILARRLHPDVNGGGDGKRMERWRAVQLAYQAGDLDLLESFCLQDDGTLGQGESLSWLTGRVSRTEKTLARALRELQSYRRDPAWGCGRGGWESTVGPKVEAWLRARLAEIRKETRELKSRTRQWQRESERMLRAEQDRERPRVSDVR
ncbi:J domain-containing protein [Methylacidimicrobium sp. B4]|uniref:J domain-containing protein n=1 Tax=Methylacidimicrobium sp. B4 TaxID=2796139 RepID=UPI001A90B18B|nr:J domain-containing protein [Methylacidimicrobium sp. B4]QSR84054.1 J domain-containing protein [Methylacidimicrobium sp. B4]